ncbi:Fe-only nitrogenase accessory AnfO family protein [Parasporobacterium paucivorans]|uniref:Iron only nitrogenase protein AnfO (AnfO_nitrog) n=1 Tax=Parasporobacterium paucivorans DSM 15970 TaxID=1122934 RepID=A0A1M6IJP3_9FIRM|nr:Fe-only nitrogenase accessory AnfO family protein [Parasporobacterium paucivorans]SHJ34658.1 Iron only nitrogenase protein AnfO (AnfO_nitrog) [Parasporobacterium paucivorans DSM 15970]
MKKMIAVLFDNENKITDFIHADHIVVYGKMGDSWSVAEELKGVRMEGRDGEGIRTHMNEIICRLGECKALVGSIITGVPYYILEKNRFIVCEADEFSDELLEQMGTDFYDVKEGAAEEDKKEIPLGPVSTDNEGNYYFDYAAAAKKYPELTSKKALLPFFSNELFQSVTIICTHIMPWIDSFLEQSNLQMESRRNEGLYTIKIFHKICRNQEEMCNE